MPLFRLICTKTQCIVTFTDLNLASLQYLALSYVWGHARISNQSKDTSFPLELNSGTSASLHRPGALGVAAVPQTIRDTIELAISLDVPYVWVDRLCILQDSIADKATQIGRMHHIYNAATLTVVAAAGEHAEHGLPGLRPNSRTVEQKEIVVLEPCQADCNEDHQHILEGLSLLTTVDPIMRSFNYLDTAAWNTRGWTMQEKFLARRSLVFTDEQVRFICTEASFLEETFCELPFPRMQRFETHDIEMSLRHTQRHFAEDGNPRTAFWKRYSVMVRRFTSRNFSFPGDIYDAFVAVAQALTAKSHDIFLWGLPSSPFELALMWNTFEGQHRRDALTTLPMTNLKRRVQFPSWSWMGWVGETTIAVNADRLENETPTIGCYVHQHGTGGTELVPVQSLATGRSRLQVHLPPVTWKTHRNRTVSYVDIQKHLPKLSSKRMEELPSHHVLFFWSSTVRLKVAVGSGHRQRQALKLPRLQVYCFDCLTVKQHLDGTTEVTDDEVPDPDSYCPVILNAHGEVIGELDRMKVQFWRDSGCGVGLQDFIVMGRRCTVGLEDVFPPKLLVMLVEEKHGIHYRICMGEVEEAQWRKAESEWKLIALG